MSQGRPGKRQYSGKVPATIFGSTVTIAVPLRHTYNKIGGADMRRANSLLVVGIVALGIVAAYLWNELRKERQLGPQSRSAAVAQNPELQQLRDIPAPPAVQPVAAMPAQTAPGSALPALPTDPVARDIELRKRNPNYIGVVEGKSAQMQLRYPDLARELGITPAEAESLYDLLLNQQRELTALPRYAGEDEALRRETQRVVEELQRKQKVELDAKLAGRQQQWKDYQPTLDARRRVSELTNMVNTTSPLSDYQSRMLVANVVSEQQRRANEQNLRSPPANTPLAQLEFDEANQHSREESNRRTVEASRSYLTEQQVTIMKNAMDGLNRQIRTQLAIRRAQIEGGAATSARGP
jgi:hypothetical protein